MSTTQAVATPDSGIRNITQDIDHLVHPKDAGDFLHALLDLAEVATAAVTSVATSGNRLAAAANLFGDAIGELGRGQVSEGTGDASKALTQGLGEVRHLGLALGQLFGEDWR